MIRVLAYLIPIVLMIFSFIDCLQASTAAIRVLPRLVWLIVVVVIPVVGPLAWLFAGRPKPISTSRRGGRPNATPAPLGPDDDPEYLRKLRDQAQREQIMRERRAREAREREVDDDATTPTDEPGPSPV